MYGTGPKSLTLTASAENEHGGTTASYAVDGIIGKLEDTTTDSRWSAMMITDTRPENKITFAVTKQNREFIIDLSLDKLMEQLDPDVFFRSNRQTVVSINAIVKVESYFLGKAILHVKPPFKDKIIVSRDKIAPLKLWLNY